MQSKPLISTHPGCGETARCGGPRRYGLSHLGDQERHGCLVLPLTRSRQAGGSIFCDVAWWEVGRERGGDGRERGKMRKLE
jgi:hypothetical protein